MSGATRRLELPNVRGYLSLSYNRNNVNASIDIHTRAIISDDADETDKVDGKE